VIREHYEAVRALIPGTVRVYAWGVPDAPSYPYVVIWGDLGDESSGGPDGESLDDVAGVLSLRVRATYAGLTGDSVLIVARNVRAALNRKTPTVTGWRTNPLRQSTLMDVQVDTDVTIPGSGAHPLYAVDEFALISQKL
jgi:hypothetical protein